MKPHTEKPHIFKQPGAVWAVAFACVISFMGLGLVDPILPAIGKELHATKAQVELLFTSYLLVTGVAMLITGFVSSRIGPKWTLIIGLLFIITFAYLGGSSNTIGQIVDFRAGWGLGNALFISTALAVIVAVSTGGTASAIILYEAALGIGISVGPLLGGELGSISWRGPFYGVAGLMTLAFLAILFLLKGVKKPERKSSLLDPFAALKYPGLLTLSIVALFYNYGFFTLLAYSPYVLPTLDTHQLGYTFFGWGILLAITSVFVAPIIERYFGTAKSMMGILLVLVIILIIMGIFTSNETVVITMIVLSGGFLGINNTLITTAVMEAAPVDRAVASSAYSFVRFTGGGLAPWLAGSLSLWINDSFPFFFGAFAVLLSVFVLFFGRKHIKDIS